ncbi:MAG: YhcH/YjgK/YiaL family protein [Sphaerochaeta sp.]|nr:YhcH/YjgK/YiaL family protein [Sphaerochaeta sp.]
MIYDMVSALDQYAPLIEHLSIVKQVLENENLLAKESGMYTTSHPQVRYMLLSYENSGIPRSYEVYAETTSIHVILKGKELMAFSWREHATALAMDDRGMAQLDADPIGVVYAKEGHMAIFLPGEPHTYAMKAEDSTSNVKKVVFLVADR